MQDVLPPNDPRSIRSIPVPASRRQFTPLPDEYAHVSGGSGHKKSFWFLVIAVVIACVLGAVLLSGFLFTGASVAVTPRQANIPLPATIDAQQEAPAGVLAYQLVNVSQTSKKSVPASGTTQVSAAAQGTITIYNTYSTAPQKLIANTRFQAPDGKIYRIHSAVTIPGGKKAANGTISPGTVQATVFADAPGPDYNRGSTQFTIPGFKGDPRYSKFYAQTDGISGGFVGTRPSVSAADLQNAKTSLQQDLASALQSQATTKIPDGFLPVAGTFSVQYADVSVSDAGSGNADVSQSATASEAIVRASDIANAIAKANVQGYNGEAVNFAGPKAISLAVATGTPYSTTGTTLSIALSGTSPIVWQFDPQKLQQALAGKNKADFNSIIATFAPAVAKATATIRPFWSTSFPQNSAKIQINVTNAS